MEQKKQPVILAVLDGWGIGPPGPGNAIALANTPNFDKFQKQYPSSSLTACGRDVGLKEGEPGNSEAGHENMGAGRTIVQDKVEILNSIHDGTFFKNAAFVEAINHVKKNNSRVHLMGLLSDGRSGHSEPDHLEALLVLMKKAGIEKVFLHLFTDGRDTPPKSAEKFLKRLHLTMNNIGIGKIASIAGRYYGMDRAHNYQRMSKAYNAIVHGHGKVAVNAYKAVKQAYERGETDEFIIPTVIPHKDGKGKKQAVVVADNDAIIFFNLRSDRARQMTKAFVQPETLNNGSDGQANGFIKLKNIFFVTMAEFGTDLPVVIAYPTRRVPNSLPIYLEKQQHLHQLYISESEKFAHVTYFFHGNSSAPLRNEKKIRIDSKKCATYDLEPEMSSKEITDTLLLHLRKNLYNFVLVNFPNADMLGHTGDIKAAVKGIEAIDRSLGRIYEVVSQLGGTLLITADHGNADQMLDPVTKNQTHEHSLNPVPFITVSEELKNKKCTLRDGSLRDIAPTVLDLLGLKKPDEMLGISLLKK